MKIDRRAFLSLGLGAAAGTAITPLPWKLIDDSSIWTQNWPWTPVPPVGKVTYVNSVCTLCPGGCGITVRKSGDRAIKIEGRDDHPVNKGGICMLGLSGLQLLYGPTRIQTPLKRMGERGENRFKPISWTEALTTLQKSLQQIRDNKKSHELACILGNNSDSTTDLFKRFCQAYGTPNVFQMPSAQDISKDGLKRMQGDEASIAYDLENADYILSFGTALIDGWGAPGKMFRAHGERKSALKQSTARLVHIDSRLSNTAAKADSWFAVKPGTEAVLALAMAQFIIHEHRYNHDFARTYIQGMDAFKEMVDQSYTPAKAASITGLDSEIIRFLAKDFSQAKRPVALFGRGSLDSAGSVQEFMAIHALNALVGNINEKGGVWAKPEISLQDWKPAELDGIAIDGLNQKPIDPDSKINSNRPHRLIDSVSQAKAPVSCLMIYGANPAYQLSNQTSVKEAFAKIPMIVSFSTFMDETAILSDLILPDHFYLEKTCETMTPPGVQKPIVSLQKPVVKPVNNTRHSGDVVIGLAKKMGGAIANAFPWPDYNACLKQRLGQHWSTLDKSGFVEDAAYRPVRRFSTGSRKFEFISNSKQKITFEPVAIDGDKNKFPLILVPCDSIRLVADGSPTPPFMMKTLEDTVLKGNDVLVEINSRTAKLMGLKHNDVANLNTPQGSTRVRVNVHDGIMENIMAIPRGLGHTAYDDYLSGKGVNYMSLIKPVEDSVTGQDVAWGIRASISKA